MTRQFATFRLEDAHYGIEVACVQEVLSEQPRTVVPLAPPAVAGLINLRGQVVTALDLRARVGLPPREGDRPSMNIVVRVGDEVVALLVDSIGDVVEVEDKDFESPPDTLGGPLRDLITGAYKLPGHLLLSLDVLRAVALPAAA